jgi:hypothetical protein
MAHRARTNVRVQTRGIACRHHYTCTTLFAGMIAMNSWMTFCRVPFLVTKHGVSNALTAPFLCQLNADLMIVGELFTISKFLP